GTPAADFPNQVAAEEKKERCQRLAELEQRLARRYYQNLIGRDLTVLVEARPATRPGHVLGTACRYLPVEPPGTTRDVGELIEVRAEQMIANGVSGSRREWSACRQ